MKKREESGDESVNTLLRKSEGDIARLTDDEVLELQRMLTERVIKNLSETVTPYHPGVNPLIACLREEAHHRRLSQVEAAEMLGISYGHYNKLISGKFKTGISVAKRLHKNFGLDGNFILENLE